MDPIGKLAIIGVGLIGGSVGKAVKERGLAREVWGVVRREASLREVLDRAAADRTTLDLGEGVRDADIVIVCTGVHSIVSMVERAEADFREECVVTDVGSVKGPIVSAMDAKPRRFRFVGSHPVAGSEKKGVAWSSGDLFEGATTLITPTERTDPGALETVKGFWAALGSTVRSLSPDTHDRAMAAVSHLPHLLAATLVNCLGEMEHSKEVLSLSAGGYRDTTRIAAGPADIWNGILMGNREHLSRVLELFRAQLEKVGAALEAGDGESLLAFLQSASSRRKAKEG